MLAAIGLADENGHKYIDASTSETEAFLLTGCSSFLVDSVHCNYLKSHTTTLMNSATDAAKTPGPYRGGLDWP